MIRVRQIQYRVTQQHEQLLMLAFEQSREWLFARLDDNTIAHPLPELGLCCPKLFPVFADDECCLFLPLLLRAHREYTSALAYIGHTQKPRREASLARQHRIFKLLKNRTPRSRWLRACFVIDGCVTQRF